MEDFYINVATSGYEKVFIRPSDIMYFKDSAWPNRHTEVFLKGKKTPVILNVSANMLLKKLQAHHDMMKLQEEKTLEDKKVEENV